ncbi:hypothetical protein EDEG_02342 [Edhazardia aedis USNM 41457]|uniref:Uncharacterized protein n=1 Tax=Edhazardia aedis (strain USNM 41457) TaxID=1003232 RepID=J8ZUG5_EDHAE|nr:hypothetical protein EDEG_02342 [Edhazardia aedis USNM 41457]|eukprot:EJW03318.1 hypothetical protein EDEG_02342 [Edhazardia aedis USNM 41457]
MFQKILKAKMSNLLYLFWFIEFGKSAWDKLNIDEFTEMFIKVVSDENKKPSKNLEDFCKKLDSGSVNGTELNQNTIFPNPKSEIKKKSSTVSNFKSKENEKLQNLVYRVNYGLMDFSKFPLNTEFDYSYFDEKMKNEYKLHYPIGDSLELSKFDHEFSNTLENEDIIAEEKITPLNQPSNFDLSFDLNNFDQLDNENMYKIEFTNLDKNPYKNFLTDYNLDEIFEDSSVIKLNNDNKTSNVEHLATSLTKNSSDVFSNDVKDIHVTSNSSSMIFFNPTHYHEVESEPIFNNYHDNKKKQPLLSFKVKYSENDDKKQIKISNRQLKNINEKNYVKNKNVTISYPHSISEPLKDQRYCGIDSAAAIINCNSNTAIRELAVFTDSHDPNTMHRNCFINYKDSKPQKKMKFNQIQFFQIHVLHSYI